MSNNPTGNTIQVLENQLLDKTVDPHVMRRGIMGKAADGSWYNLSTDTSGKILLGSNDKSDTNNSTVTPLAGDATFTGSATDTFGYSYYTMLVHSDVASADEGLIVEYSPDGTEWFGGEAYTIPANKVKFFTPPLQERYVRVTYTNGSDPQTDFHLHAILRQQPIKDSSHNINDNLNDDDDATLTASVLKLRTAQNTYVSGAATTNGNFKISLEETNGFEPTQSEGGEVTVGTTPVELTFTDQTKTIFIQSDHDNTGNIWIGESNLTNTTNRQGRLMAGESMTITLNDASEAVYVVSDTASQLVYKKALTQ